MNAYLAIDFIQTKLMTNLKRDSRTRNFSNNNINKFIFLLRKFVFSYE